MTIIKKPVRQVSFTFFDMMKFEMVDYVIYYILMFNLKICYTANLTN